MNIKQTIIPVGQCYIFVDSNSELVMAVGSCVVLTLPGFDHVIGPKNRRHG